MRIMTNIVACRLVAPGLQRIRDRHADAAAQRGQRGGQRLQADRGQRRQRPAAAQRQQRGPAQQPHRVEVGRGRLDAIDGGGEMLDAARKQVVAQQIINGEITAPQLRLVAENGDQLGIVAVGDALRMAEEQNVDLVEIAPLAVPPVCKLMDYGKFRYREQKKAHEAKLKQKQIQVKEVKIRPGTDENDYQVKLRNLARFLNEGDKVKVTLRFRGREMAHQELGLAQLQRIEADVGELAIVEQIRSVRFT